MMVPVKVISRNLNRRDCPLGSSLVSVEFTSFDISATGSQKRFILLQLLS